MNVVFVSMDSLNRHYLPAYGQTVEYPVATPNLDRFARREWLTGVQEFLWRPWGPVEPFDTPLARAARRAGVTTQLVTDHYHLFQHGSHGYYEDYAGYELVRGHEYDAWRTAPRDPDPALLRQLRADRPHDTGFLNRAAYARNAAALRSEEEFFAPRVFTRAARWLRENREHPRWLLVVGSFDVHEPFHNPEPYASMYTTEDPRDPALTVWPEYGRIDRGSSALSPREVAFVRAQYAGKLTMTDRWFGALLDALDELALWDTTAVFVTTDHGHYLGDHGWMGKPGAPLYDVLARTPLFAWLPGGAHNGGAVGALTSAVDLYATALDALGVPVPAPTHSRSLLPLLRGESDRHREWALYGYWGSTVNVTNGEYAYLHPCREDAPAYLYSAMMLQPHAWFSPPEPRPDAEARRFLPYADCPVWRYPARAQPRHERPMLFDVGRDPAQREDLAGTGAPAEARMRELLRHALGELEAPADQLARLGFS